MLIYKKKKKHNSRNAFSQHIIQYIYIHLKWRRAYFITTQLFKSYLNMMRVCTNMIHMTSASSSAIKTKMFEIQFLGLFVHICYIKYIYICIYSKFHYNVNSSRELLDFEITFAVPFNTHTCGKYYYLRFRYLLIRFYSLFYLHTYGYSTNKPFHPHYYQMSIEICIYTHYTTLYICTYVCSMYMLYVLNVYMR